MKKFIYKSMMLTAMAFAAISCSTDEIDTFMVEENAIRFPGVTGGVNGDTYYSGYNSSDRTYYGSYSFIENPTAEWTEYLIPLNVIGKVSDKSRTVNWQVVEDGTTAPEEAYEIVDAVIPAGEREGFIRINIANKAELLSTSYQLKLTLKESADFKLGPKEYLNAILTWNNVLPVPTHKQLLMSYNMLINSSLSFSSNSNKNYSTSAHLAIVDALGWDDWGDAEAHPGQSNNASLDNFYNYLPRYTWIYMGDLYKAYAKKLDDYLKAYEAERGAPLLHDGGNLIGQPVKARQY